MSDDAAEANAKNPRFTHWAASLIFSIITMTSAIIIVGSNGHLTNQTASFERWAVICPAVNLSLSGLVVLMYLIPPLRRIIEGSKIEGLLILIMVGWWAAGVAIITDAKRGVAVDQNGSVSNGNVYYFGWAGFVSSVTLFVSYMRTAFGVDIEGEIQSRSARLNLWAALLSTAIVVMASSAQIFAVSCAIPNAQRQSFANGTYCMRALYGTCIGACAVFLALLIISLKFCLSKMPLILETISAYLLAPAWIIGVCFITSNSGPGSGLGNLYYFTWLSFLLSFMLAASVTDERKQKNMASDIV